MTLVRPWISAVLVALALIVVPTRDAHAQWAVLDVANLGESILTAMQTLQSNVNEAQQIANQIQQLNNEFQNLQRIPGGISAGLLVNYVNAWTKMANTFTAINGLAANTGTLAVNYNNLYPARGGAPLSGVQVIAQLQRYLAEARQTYQGVYQQSGAVMASLPQAQNNLTSTLAASTGASGNLDAIQAQTQMTAQVAQLLMQQNAQIAAMNQAQADWLNQQMESLDSARVMQQQSEARIPRTQPPGPFLPAVH